MHFYILDLEVLYLFALDRISYALYIAVYLDIVLLDFLKVSFRVCHLRSYEDHPVMVAKGTLIVYCYFLMNRFKHSYQFCGISCFCCYWLLGRLLISIYLNLDYMLVLSSLLWIPFYDYGSTHHRHTA